MKFFVPERRFDPLIPEMMDRGGIPGDVLRDDLRQLRRINEWFGGLSVMRTALEPLLDRVEGGREMEILDLATGSADQPINVVQLCRERRQHVKVTAMDKNDLMLEVAREQTHGYKEIAVSQGDILSPQFSERSFDIVLCSLAIHHFSREDAIRILRNMKRLSRVGCIVNELNRSWIGAWTAWLYTHLVTRNPVTLYDSYVSVLRAFTPDELGGMAQEAGWTNFKVSRHPFFRLILVHTNDV